MLDRLLRPMLSPGRHAMLWLGRQCAPLCFAAASRWRTCLARLEAKHEAKVLRPSRIGEPDGQAEELSKMAGGASHDTAHT